MGTNNLKRLMVLLVMSVLTSSTSAQCRAKYYDKVNCNFEIHCCRKVKNITIPDNCEDSTNQLVTLKLSLCNKHGQIEHNFDLNVIESVTTFRFKGKWDDYILTMLKRMPQLKSLFLVNNFIKNFTGDPFYSLNNLELLDLSHNSLNDIRNLFRFDNFDNILMILNLSYNNITELHMETFMQLSSLEDIDLSYNSIEDVGMSTFLYLTNLKTLNLNSNNLKLLNGALNKLKFLKNLFLKNNQLKYIETDMITIVTHLENFDISDNKLTELAPNVFTRHWKHFDKNHICIIKLSENRITKIPNAPLPQVLERYQKVNVTNERKVTIATKLYLSKNEISMVDYDSFKYIDKLVFLDLSSNRLTVFSINPNTLAYLEYLNLANNYISNMNTISIQTKKLLNYFNISNNALFSIHDEVFKNSHNLKHIDLSSNSIKKLNNFYIRGIPNSRLDISNNIIDEINVAEGSHITTLILDTNDITELHTVNLQCMSGLKYLKVRNNGVQYINRSCINIPDSLINLDLSNNFIEHIGPSTFSRFIHLINLNLSNNLLAKLSYGVFNGLKSLKILDLSYNDLTCLSSKRMGELKQMDYLSLKFNALTSIDYQHWVGHNHTLYVPVDGNKLSCDWLRKAINDHNRGYSQMCLMQIFEPLENSVDDISCVEYSLEKRNDCRNIIFNNDDKADERLLYLNRKILEAIKQSTTVENCDIYNYID